LIREGESPNGPSKSELKKRAKEAEKQRKAAEKAARQEELAKQKAAADMVLFYMTANVSRLISRDIFRLLLPSPMALFLSTSPSLDLAKFKL
jgi:hypothetical protein